MLSKSIAGDGIKIAGHRVDTSTLTGHFFLRQSDDSTTQFFYISHKFTTTKTTMGEHTTKTTIGEYTSTTCNEGFYATPCGLNLG